MRNKKSKMIRNLISYNTKEAIKSPKTGKREKRDTEKEEKEVNRPSTVACTPKQ